MTWEDTVATMLLGTERRPERTEDELLADVAMEATRRRAGKRVREADFAINHCPPETQPECPTGARQLLELARVDHFGAGSRDPLTALWVERCAEAGRIVPATLVPDLLDFGRTDPGSRPHLRAVIGERGRWLAALADNWKWFGGADDAEDVALDSVVVRLRGQRGIDAKQGREEVVDAARGRAAADRAELFLALEVGLSAADEPLLEEMLDDRSRKVKKVALEFLSRLPDSAYSRRMVARIEPLVVKRRLSAGFKLELPDSLDEEAERDGIAAKGDGMVAQIFAGVPLTWWEATVGAADSVAGKAPFSAVREGWIEAARRQCNGEWAVALFDAQPEPRLLEIMTGPDADTRLAAVSRRLPIPKLTDMLRHGPHRWPPDLSVAIARVLKESRVGNTSGLAGLIDLLDRIDESAVDRVTRSVEHLPDTIQRQVARSLNRVRFRIAIDQEFT